MDLPRSKQAFQFDLPKMLLTLDMFSAPLPVFNLKGRESVRTYCGGCVSLVIMYVTFLFALLKLQHLLSKHNPTVNTFTEHAAFGESDVWTGEENNDFMMAFTVVDYESGEVRDDLSFVKWFAHLWIVVDGEASLVEIPMNPCSDEDFAKFYEPN